MKIGKFIILLLLLLSNPIPNEALAADSCYIINLKVKIDGAYDTYTYFGKHTISAEAVDAAISAAKLMYRCTPAYPQKDCTVEVIYPVSFSETCD